MRPGTGQSGATLAPAYRETGHPVLRRTCGLARIRPLMQRTEDYLDRLVEAGVADLDGYASEGAAGWGGFDPQSLEHGPAHSDGDDLAPITVCIGDKSVEHFFAIRFVVIGKIQSECIIHGRRSDLPRPGTVTGRTVQPPGASEAN